MWEEIANFKVTASKTVASMSSETKVSVNVEQDDFAEGSTFPAYWTAKSPVHEGGEPIEVKLRMGLKLPEVDSATQRVSGAPQFSFSLWTPDAATIRHAGYEDAVNRMRDALGEGFVIVRGTINPGSVHTTLREDTRGYR